MQSKCKWRRAADYNTWCVGDREIWRKIIEETGIALGRDIWSVMVRIAGLGWSRDVHQR